MRSEYKMSHEPPVKKRQRIEDVASTSSSNSINNTSSPSTSSFSSTSSNSIENLSHLNGGSEECINTSVTTSGIVLEHDWTEFIDALQQKQCLCGLSETAIRRPFQRYLCTPLEIAHIVPLDEWPSDQLLKFLSSVLLFFDIYLKQNSRGNICSKSVELCDCIVNSTSLNLLEDVLEMCYKVLQSSNRSTTKFLLYLSGRVISYYLIIIKEDLDHRWLKKIVDNLFISDNLNDLAIKKISFSLDIIKHIIEFKDMDEHPLEEDLNDYYGVDNLALVPPPIENNYFAQQYLHASSSGSGATASIANSLLEENSSNRRNSLTHSHLITQMPTDCHFVTLTDSESFDTTHIKCVTVKILENKFPALVKTMSTLITTYGDDAYVESCAVVFISLWENIISVKANLSVVETLPFHAQLDKFESLLSPEPNSSHHLSPVIYKQMLALFNEALCYGSTLALQDLLPPETCNLAHQIVRQVKDNQLFSYLPQQRTEQALGFAGHNSAQVEYESNSLSPVRIPIQTSPTNLAYDRTTLQKVTLLVLKSVAVTVKEIRSDSSDSSIDSQDYDAVQDMQVIERSIRDVIKKLETFIKIKMEFHPETHFSKILIHLFSDQDDYLIESMVCTLDVTAGISFRNSAFPELVAMLNPVFTFLEFLKMISNSPDLLLDLLVSNETCFLLYLLRYLKYIRNNWSIFVQSCQDFGMGHDCLDDTMSVLIRLRLQISRLVSRSLYPYDISPILRLLESCESLYEGNELS